VQGHEKIAPTFWILARAGGVTTYLLIVAAIVLGLCVKTRVLSRVRPVVVVDLHRLVSLIALGALGIHIGSLILDANKPASIISYVVPGLMPYRPLWTGIGVGVAELMIVIHLSFRYRSKIGARNWRRLHWATYLVFIGATVHGLASGSDSNLPWAQAMYAIALAVVVGLTAWRALSPRPVARPRPASPVPRPNDQGAS
jgi:methionine sulfoxide reductase heme-binding subunit